MSAAGKHVVIVGGGDTGADCLGTAVREGAASVTQLDIYAQPGAERDEDAEPWPTYPKIYRLSAAHEEARRSADGAGGGRGRAAVRGVHAPLRPGTRTGTCGRCTSSRSTRSAGRWPETGRTLPADLVLLALGFSGPDRADGLVDQLGLAMEPRGTITRDVGLRDERARRVRGRGRRARAVADRVGDRGGPGGGGGRRPPSDGEFTAARRRSGRTTGRWRSSRRRCDRRRACHLRRLRCGLRRQRIAVEGQRRPSVPATLAVDSATRFHVLIVKIRASTWASSSSPNWAAAWA